MQRQNNLIVSRPNYYEFSTKSLTSLEPKICNCLPVNTKSDEKKFIETWDGEMCKWQMCTYNTNH